MKYSLNNSTAVKIVGIIHYFFLLFSANLCRTTYTLARPEYDLDRFADVAAARVLPLRVALSPTERLRTTDPGRRRSRN